MFTAYASPWAPKGNDTGTFVQGNQNLYGNWQRPRPQGSSAAMRSDAEDAIPSPPPTARTCPRRSPRSRRCVSCRGRIPTPQPEEPFLPAALLLLLRGGPSLSCSAAAASSPSPIAVGFRCEMGAVTRGRAGWQWRAGKQGIRQATGKQGNCL
jgi:hypothetical protein